MQKIDSKQVAEFYDEYSSQQHKIGVNIRHRSILKRLLKLGLSKNSSILEIGCGIGTLTSLLVKNSGNVLAIDISPASIEIAKKNLSSSRNISFKVSDMSDFTVDQKFDFIILPDVMEHIPIEQHKSIFGKLKNVLAENGRICIHIPDPYALEWIRKNNPELLQIIDQSLYSGDFIQNVYANDLALHKLERYCLQHTLPDYQWIEVIHRPQYVNFENKKYSKAIIDELKSRI
jgi:trans-aconitate 2-methyltransferase